MLLKVAGGLALISTASAAVTTVQVGQGGFVFAPNSITAAVGDVVNFKFTGAPGNHTVSQAAFAKPCEQLAGGFDSGPVPVAAGFSGPFAEWNLTITNASAPIWFYCKATVPSSHCIAGMVGAINPPSSGNTLDKFTSAAKALSSLPAQSAGSTSGVGAAASATPAAPAAASGSTKPNSAVHVAAGGVWTLVATVLGVVMA